jgi:adenine C2-methylase RlmN of 23S rRNA A2503 and tRNA A37
MTSTIDDAPPRPQSGTRRPPLASIWDFDAMLELGFTDSNLRRLWLALLSEPTFLPSALGRRADADDARAAAADASASSSTPLLFTSPACQRALDRMRPPLPKRLRAALEETAEEGGGSDTIAAMSCRAALVRRSKRGDAVKLLVRLGDGLEVETVVMVYRLVSSGTGAGAAAGGDDDEQQADPEEEEQEDDDDRSAPSTTTAKPSSSGRRRSAQGVRTAVCFSSQYGCRLGCVFCATGKMGVGANLSAGEIVEQVVLARAACLEADLPPPASALAMGQGEPVCGGNYNAVVSAVRSLTHPARGFGLARRRVTLSTVGAVPRRIVDLARDLPGVSLALSLHAPTQSEREAIVPSAKAAPLPKLLAAVDAYTSHTKQRVFVEYVLLAGVNDTVAHARALRELLSGRDVVVNAIPWNPVLAAGEDGEHVFEFEAPSAESVAAFHQEVWLGGKEGGVPCTVRQERGQDIEGACGQLATAVARERQRRQREQREREELRVGGVVGGCGGGGGGGGKGGCGGGGGKDGDVEDAAGARDQQAGGDDPPPPPQQQSLWRRLLALRTS